MSDEQVTTMIKKKKNSLFWKLLYVCARYIKMEVIT